MIFVKELFKSIDYDITPDSGKIRQFVLAHVDRLTSVLKNTCIELLFMTKVGRNDPCLCGSGKKYKKCCWLSDQRAEQQFRSMQPRHEDILSPQKRQRIIDENEPLLQTMEQIVNERYKQNPSLTGVEVINVYKALLGVLTRRVEGSELNAAIERLSPCAREIHDALKSTILRMDEIFYPETTEPQDQDLAKSGAGDIVTLPRDQLSEKSVPVISDCLSLLIDSAKFWTREGGAKGYLNYISNFLP